MILNDIRSDVMLNRALLWAILARLTESDALAVVFTAMALWCLLAALMGVGE